VCAYNLKGKKGHWKIGGKKKIEEDMKMLHEKLNLKLKYLRNLKYFLKIERENLKSYET
jgi:hypothetical protein